MLAESIGTLLIIVPYAAAYGSRQETTSLLADTAKQIRQLGIHKQETVALFEKDAQVERSFFTHMYMDT